MKVRLQIRLTTNSSRVWEHTGPVVRVGRNPGCELSLNGEGTPTVSWEHAVIEPGPEGVLVRDMGSSNGTYVNGRLLKGAALVQVGDQVGLGQTGPRLHVLEVIHGAEVVTGPANQPPAVGIMPQPPLAVAVSAPVANRAAVVAGPAVVPQAPPIPAQGGAQVLDLPARVVPLPNPTPAASPLTDHPASTTRLLLVAFQKRHQRMWVILGVAAVCLIGAVFLAIYIISRHNSQTEQLLREAEIARQKAEKAILSADKEVRKVVKSAEERERKAKADHDRTLKRLAQLGISGQEIYERTLRSTACVAVRLKNGGRGNGSGSLVDKQRRLVLTAYHVVDKMAEVGVIFPRYEDGKVISDRTYYYNNLARVLIPGKVVASNAQSDLAIIQLDSLPKGVLELPLAATSPSPGSRVHTVGNPGASAGFWAYTFGAVRQVARKKYTFAEKNQIIDARVVETQNPINKGDSGGPVVNDKMELVAVNSGATPNIRDGTICIDVREVKTLLELVH
jgi:S1-C subfamily serine protease